MLPYQIDDELVAGMGMMQLGTGEVHAAQAAGAVQARSIQFVFDWEGRSEARPARRIKLFDEDVDILGRLIGIDVASRRRQAGHVDVRIQKRQGDGEGAVDTRVRQQDYLMRHDNAFPAREATEPTTTARRLPNNILPNSANRRNKRPSVAGHARRGQWPAPPQP